MTSAVSGNKAAVFVDGAVSLARSFGRYALEPMGRFLDLINSVQGSNNRGLDNAAASRMEPEYQALIQEQIHQQEQMQLVSLVSNAEKSKHESAMTPLRNIRVG